jgi:hypothetical protein
MVGRHNGVAAKLRTKIENFDPDSSFAHFHCIIHQQNLCSKILKLGHMFSLVTKTVNYIRGRALNHRQFSQLLEDEDNQFTDIPFYTEKSAGCHVTEKILFVETRNNYVFGDERSKHR